MVTYRRLELFILYSPFLSPHVLLTPLPEFFSSSTSRCNQSHTSFIGNHRSPSTHSFSNLLSHLVSLPLPFVSPSMPLPPLKNSCVEWWSYKVRRQIVTCEAPVSISMPSHISIARQINKV